MNNAVVRVAPENVRAAGLRGSTRAARKSRNAPKHCCTAGFSYVEVMVATVVLAVALVPAIEALSTAPQSAEVHRQHLRQHYRLVDTMETLLSESFSALEAEASTPGSPTASAVYSDVVSTPARRLVYISAYDGDNADSDDDPFTGTDDRLLWIRVEIENSALALEALATP